MALSARSVTVGVTATLINTDNQGTPRDITVKVPAGGATVFIGGADVTTTAGFPVAAGEKVELHLTVDDDVYGIVVGPATQAVNVIETRI